VSSESKATYGLVGYPLTHSLSPLMHNAAFEALDVEAEYKLFSLKENELDGFFEGLRDPECPIFGFNVTVPYKEKVLTYMDSVTPIVDKIRAVNTVVVNNQRKFIAYNTDAPGFLAHLAELGFDAKDKKISIVGAGGAARAIVAVLCLTHPRPSSVKLYDVDTDKAGFLIEDLGRRMDVSIVERALALDDLDIPETDLLINATPLGLKPDDPLPVDFDLLHKGLMVYDLVYNPSETPLLKAAAAKGAETSNGLGMLYYQGVLAFQHWAGMELKPNVKKKMRVALEKGLKKNDK